MVTFSSFILFAFVMAFAARRKGAMLDSVSEVAYIIHKWAFTAWMAIVGMLLMPALMESLPESCQWLGFLSVVGALCVAASPYYKTESRVLHYGGGAFCAILSTVIVAMLQPLLLLAWALIPFLPRERMFVSAEILIYLQLIFSI